MASLSRDQVREVDHRAMQQLGMPGLMLMENAAINAVAQLQDWLGERGDQGQGALRGAILCGGGNNGGDGYAIARHLHNRGDRVTLFAAKAPDQLKGDAAVNSAICANMGLPITRIDEPAGLDQAAAEWGHSDLIIDALLGTGFTGEVRDPVGSIIDRVNALEGPPVVAIDAPTGLDCQSGEPAASTIRAALTITVVALKTGFEQARAHDYTGELRTANIGVPPELVKAVANQQ
jgi:NAD(P)H-hydrate epimerase